MDLGCETAPRWLDTGQHRLGWNCILGFFDEGISAEEISIRVSKYYG